MVDGINYWQETNSGMRSSTAMFAGVLLAILGGLMQFAVPYILSQGSDTANAVTSVFWLLWILSLWTVGIAFIWVGNLPTLTRFGTFVGLFHLVQGAFLLVVLFTDQGAMAPPLVFTVGRLMALLLFGLIERNNIGVTLSIFIWVSSLLQLLKITLRVMGTLPEMGFMVQSALDTAFLLLICAALFQLGRHLRKVENFWAKEKYETRNSGFSDFNNPEHKWDQ